MGFTEAAHDDGKISGRGSPLKRGLAYDARADERTLATGVTPAA